MTLRECVTRTTVEIVDRAVGDAVFLRTKEGSLDPATEAFTQRVEPHLERLRGWAGEEVSFRVATENSFPMGAGMASSASGFAALTLAVVTALGRQVSSEEASVLARLSGSGSAARSVLGGYVKWPAGEGPEEEHATQVAPAEHWDLRDVVAVLQEQAKEVSSREGHERAPSSPYFEPRQKLLPAPTGDQSPRQFWRETSRPLHRLSKRRPSTSTSLQCPRTLPSSTGGPAPSRSWRPFAACDRKASEVCATMDAGANVHMICTPESETVVAEEGWSDTGSELADPRRRRTAVPGRQTSIWAEAMTAPMEVVLVKLGGSLITDKRRPETARTDVIERLGS